MLKLPVPFPFLSIVSVSVRLQTSRRAQLDILTECSIEWTPLVAQYHWESACNAGDAGLIPGSWKIPCRRKWNPQQYSCLANPMDRRAWRAAVLGSWESPTRTYRLKPANTGNKLNWCCCCCCEVASVVSDSVRPQRRKPTRLSRPWDSPGKNTGVGCHWC